MAEPESIFKIGDHILKIGEDSTFEGVIVSVFIKLNNKTVRYVVENVGGVLHIASNKQLRLMGDGVEKPIILPVAERRTVYSESNDPRLDADYQPPPKRRGQSSRSASPTQAPSEPPPRQD